MKEWDSSSTASHHASPPAKNVSFGCSKTMIHLSEALLKKSCSNPVFPAIVMKHYAHALRYIMQRNGTHVLLFYKKTIIASL